MADQSDLQQYYRLADILIEQAGKEQLAQCARLLALNLGHYQGKFGEMPLEDTPAILDATEPNDEQVVLLADPPDEMQSWAVSKRVSRSGEGWVDLIRPDDGEYSD